MPLRVENGFEQMWHEKELDDSVDAKTGDEPGALCSNGSTFKHKEKLEDVDAETGELEG